jgi:hypothetical protein
MAAGTFSNSLCVSHKFAVTGLWHERWVCISVHMNVTGLNCKGCICFHHLLLNFQHRARKTDFHFKITNSVFHRLINYVWREWCGLSPKWHTWILLMVKWEFVKACVFLKLHLICVYCLYFCWTEEIIYKVEGNKSRFFICHEMAAASPKHMYQKCSCLTTHHKLFSF